MKCASALKALCHNDFRASDRRSHGFPQEPRKTPVSPVSPTFSPRLTRRRPKRFRLAPCARGAAAANASGSRPPATVLGRIPRGATAGGSELSRSRPRPEAKPMTASGIVSEAPYTYASVGLLVLEVAVERTVTERFTVRLVVPSPLAAPHVLTDATARRLKVGPKGRQDRLAAFDDHLFVAALLGRKRRRRDKCYRSRWLSV